jgi:microsomal dipeptidase-like Zn-dependent dipeptidase
VAGLGGRVVVTHAPAFTGASVADLRAWADKGAFLELVYVFCCDGLPLPASMRRSVGQEAALIEEVGHERIVLSTDLGQEGNPPPVEGLAAFASGLLAEGIPEAAVDTMMRRNPARALGVDDGS